MKPSLSSQSLRRRSALKKVLACERRLTLAERTGDGAALRALLAPSFVGLDLRTQKVNRTQFIAGFQRPELHLATLRIDQLSVRFVGTVAIVIGRSRFTGNCAGHAFSGTSRFLDTWVRRADSWQLIASSVTPPGS